MSDRTIIHQAEALMSEGQAEEAVALTASASAAPDASYDLVLAHAMALRAAGRTDEAVVRQRGATARWPASVVAWHNLGALLGDLGDAAGSRDAIDRALAAGGDAAPTWLVRARACWMLGDFAGAEAGYGKALARAPGMTDAATELAQTIWLSRADAAAASRHLTAAWHAGADPAAIIFSQSQLLHAVGRSDEARALVIGAAQTRSDHAGLLLLAARAAVESDQAGLALNLIEQATRAGARPLELDLHRAMALLASGRPEEALFVARRAAAAFPHAQDAWGWVATAARATGDPQYASLNDYAALVRGFDIATPEGWADLDAYLKDLEAALAVAHTDRAHRLDQSARGGTQTFGDLASNPHPAIKAFFTAIDAPIRQYLADLGSGSDPLRSRNTGDYALNGAWSVKLGAQGRHIDHFHPAAFVSSAFHVRTPDEALENERQGWLRFGQPPFPTLPALPADHHVKPKAGRLVLFPSYMWHGTVPFETDEQRLSIAFDIVPK